jgi:hypothetical protein
VHATGKSVDVHLSDELLQGIVVIATRRQQDCYAEQGLSQSHGSRVGAGTTLSTPATKERLRA